MIKFTKYTHTEHKVDAVRYTKETRVQVLKALADEAELNKFSMFNAAPDSAVGGDFVITFRYLTDSVNSVLTVGNYLVRMNRGNYKVISSEEFSKRYQHTAIDTVPDVDEIKSPKQALVNYASTYHADLGITKVSDLTQDKIIALAEALKDTWYASSNNNFDIKFTDAGIVDPTGLADIINAGVNASFVNDDTSITLNFTNGTWSSSKGPEHVPNSFNYEALQELLGELHYMTPKTQRRIIAVNFKSLKDEAPSAIANSVTTEQWSSFCAQLRAITNITNNSSIKK